MNDRRSSGLSRAEGCWTFDARDRMPRPSRATARHLAKNAPTATCSPPARAGSFYGAFPSSGRGPAKDEYPPLPDVADVLSLGPTPDPPSAVTRGANAWRERVLPGTARSGHDGSRRWLGRRIIG